MRTLEFINPVFHPGLNYTVRHGKKWYDELSKGYTIYIGDQKLPTLVESIHYCHMWAIPDVVYQNQHDPACRTISGLRKAMERAYPQLAELDTADYLQQGVTYIGFHMPPPSSATYIIELIGKDGHWHRAGGNYFDDKDKATETIPILAKYIFHKPTSHFRIAVYVSAEST